MKEVCVDFQQWEERIVIISGRNDAVVSSELPRR